MLARQAQERFDVDVFEIELADFFFGDRARGRLNDDVVKLTSLRGLEILQRRNRFARDFSRMKVVEDEAQRLQLVPQNVDSLEVSRAIDRSLPNPGRCAKSRGARSYFQFCCNPTNSALSLTPILNTGRVSGGRSILVGRCPEQIPRASTAYVVNCIDIPQTSEEPHW